MIDSRQSGPPVSSTPSDGPPSVLLLDGAPQSAGVARDFARTFVAHHVPGASTAHIEDVVLVTCELVTNAIRYGTEPGDSLRLTFDARDNSTRIEVQDPTRRSPRRRPESDERVRGRGLFILDALCPGAWGHDSAPFGKVVWAEVRVK